MSDTYRSDESREAIESMIRAAGQYVQPTEDLRPRTLEAARQYCGDRRAEQKLGSLAIAVLLLVSISSPAIRYAEMLQSTASGPSAAEMHHRAIAFETRPDVGSHWGLTEAFTELRRNQASRLGRANRVIQ